MKLIRKLTSNHYTYLEEDKCILVFCDNPNRVISSDFLLKIASICEDCESTWEIAQYDNFPCIRIYYN